MLLLDITSFDEGVHHVELEPDADEVDLDPQRFRDLYVEARLDLRGRRIYATVDAEATATLECDRTLVLFDERIAGTYAVLFAPPSFAGEPDEVEEVRPLEGDARELDLTDVVRDTLLLAIPQRCVSPEAREADIETVFGEPEPEEGAPVDPRFEALRQLRDRDDA